MKKIEMHEHGKPMSRRDFVSRGLIAGGGFVVAPTLAHLLIRKANADTPPVSHTPFLVFDLAGGASLPGNFLVGNKGGCRDLLGSYSNLGWNPKKDKIDDRFGLPMAGGGVSKILDGMLAVMSAGAQANFRMGSLLHTALIDSSQNALSAITLVSKSGVIGKYVPKSLGTMASSSGGNSRPAFESLELRPLFISHLEDLTQAMGLYRTFADFKGPTALSVIRQLRRLSVSQLTRALSGNSQEIIDSFDRKHDNMEKTMGGALDLDPRKDPIFQGLYGINSNSNTVDTNVIRASITRSVIKGISGPGAITISGCDYHNGQAAGDTKDLEIGLEIGRAVEAAHKLEAPLFIQIITDGGNYPLPNTRNWAGDSNETCMSVIGYYNPKGPVNFINGKMQLGNYTEAQGADRSTLIGESAPLAAHAVFANYLQIDGRTNEFMDIAKNVFNKEQLQSVLMFEG